MYTVAQKQKKLYKKQMEVFDKHLTDRITARDKYNYINNVPDWNWLSIDEHDIKFDEEFKKVISENCLPEANDNNAVRTPDMFDLYINMDVRLTRGNDGELYHATFEWRVIDDDGKPLGLGTSNPITDKIIYEVEHTDGMIKTLASNVISENLFSQFYQEGQHQFLISGNASNKFHSYLY